VLLPPLLVKPGTTNPRPGDGDSDGLRDLVLRLFLVLHGGIVTVGDAAVAVGDVTAVAVGRLGFVVAGFVISCVFCE